MGMYPSDEPYTPEQARAEGQERDDERITEANLDHLYTAWPIFRQALLPDTMVVWEDVDGETLLVTSGFDQPRVEIRWEDGAYIAQAYDHDALLKDMVDADPQVLALTLKTYLAHVQMGQFLSASEADFYNRR